MKMLLEIIILLLVALLVLADWPKIRAALDATIHALFGYMRLKAGELWLWPAAARILPHESVAVTGGSALLILILSYPAFSGFFIAEDFTYRGLYWAAGSHFWKAILTPFQHLFFRPSAAGWYLMFDSFLPQEPWAHHLRNYLTTVIAAGLLYALTRRLVASPMARIAGVTFFAVSKVHLTTIGYINCNDSIMSLIQIETLLLLLLLYFQTDRSVFLYLSYIPYGLEVFSRDYGIAVIAIVGVALLVQSKQVDRPLRFLMIRLAPFAGITAVYFTVRTAALGAAIGSSPSYHLTFSAMPILYRAWLFTGNLFNISLGAVEVTGSGSFATLLHGIAPGFIGGTRPWDIAFVLAASMLVLLLLLRALLVDRRLWIPIVWVVAFIAPSFLIANIQMYYVLEPLAGVALALSLALEISQGKNWVRACTVLLTLTAMNTTVADRLSLYSWRFCANAAEKAYAEAIRPLAGQQLKSWTLLTPDDRSTEFWRYTLVGDGTCPMIPALLGEPQLPIEIRTMTAVPVDRIRDPRAPVYLISNDHLLRLNVPAIVSVVPNGTTAGVKFNVQPDGNAAIWVNSEDALPTSVLLWNGDPLPTTVGSAKALSALVAPRLLASPGEVRICIRDRQTGLESAPYRFEITTAAGGAAKER